MKKIIFGLAIIAIGLACSKTENPATTYLPLTNANIAGSYKITNVTFRLPDTAVEFPIFGVDTIVHSCKKDDILTFDTNGLFTYADTGKVCDSINLVDAHPYYLGSPSTISDIRTFEDDDNDYTYLVKTLTVKELVLNRTVKIPFISTKKDGVVTVTLTKQ